MKLSFVLLLISFAPCVLYSQIKEINNRTNAAGETQAYSYMFTSAIDDTVSIKIVNPQGQLMDVPFRNKSIAMHESVHFNLDARHWRWGKYQIIVESKNHGPITKGLIIASKRATRKK